MNVSTSATDTAVAARADDMGQLENYAQELRRLGHCVTVLSKKGTEVRKVAREAAKRKWTFDNKGSGITFTDDAVHGLSETLNSIEDNSDYFYGFVLMYAWARHVLQNGVYCLAYDFTHCDTGTLASFVAIDSNRNVLPLGHAHFADNENNATATASVRQAVADVPDLNDPRVVFVRDGRRELRTAITANAPRARQFSCVNHAAAAASHTVGGISKAVAVQQYQAMARALNQGSYDKAKAEVAHSLWQYVTHTPDTPAQRFLFPFAEDGGKMPASLPNSEAWAMPLPRTTSQFGEKMNHITKHSGARGVPNPLEMMRLLLEDDVKRCDGRRVESTRCTDACPPRMRMMLARLLNRVRDGGFRIDSAAADTFRFYPAYTPPGQGRRPRNWFHLVRCDGQPSEWTCACGLKKVTGFPCECLAAVAVQKKGVPDIAQLVDSEYTTAVWQAQYNFNFAATLPGSVPDGPPSRLKLPVFLPTKPGRPKRGRILSPGEPGSGGTKRRRTVAHSGDEDASQTAAALTAAAGADAGPMANAPALPAPPRAPRQYGCRRCGAPVRKGCGCKNRRAEG